MKDEAVHTPADIKNKQEISSLAIPCSLCINVLDRAWHCKASGRRTELG